MSPRYRIHCEVRAPRDAGFRVFRGGWASATGDPQPVRFLVEGRTPEAALEEFFNDHAGGLEKIGWLDENGGRNPVRGWQVDVRKRYTWIDEDGALMEYKGIEEVAAGAVPCPLCAGTGEVTPAAAEEYISG